MTVPHHRPSPFPRLSRVHRGLCQRVVPLQWKEKEKERKEKDNVKVKKG
jgi:hypothetical protein